MKITPIMPPAPPKPIGYTLELNDEEANDLRVIVSLPDDLIKDAIWAARQRGHDVKTFDVYNLLPAIAEGLKSTGK